MGLGVPAPGDGLTARTARIVLAALLAIGIVPMRAQASLPILASGNLSVVAVVPDAGSVGGRIVGDTLYTTSASGLRIYDLAAMDGIPLLRGVVPVSIYQNEDLDVAGGVALLASDYLVGAPTLLTVVDVSDPLVAIPSVTIRVPEAHTASCIQLCRYAWLGGGRGQIHVVDLGDVAAPRVIGAFPVPGSVHDVQVDADGLAWVSTGAGLFVFRPGADPLAPTLVTALENEAPGAFENDFILHNSLRTADRTVFVVEEDWDPLSNDLCANDGAFQSGQILEDARGGLTVRALDRFTIGRGDLGDDDRLPGAPVSCSAHYFDVRADGIAAVAWYEQGVRILDVSAPSVIREIGYAIGGGETISALLHDDLVYAFDTVHDLVVLRLDGGPEQATLEGPVVTRAPASGAPDPQWRYACRRGRAAPGGPMPYSGDGTSSSSIAEPDVPSA